jgi:DNA-binding NarL/FixJ family response regulator
MTVRVLIADDQQLVRTGFRLILETEEDIKVVAEAANGREAVQLARKLQPDVVLMDIRMPELDGIEATRELAAPDRQPPTRVLILTTFDLDEYVFDALRAGASGFLLKDVAASQLAAGVRMVAAGDALLAPTITRRLIEEFTALQPVELPAALNDLTPRELEIFRLVAKGLSNTEIAAQLIIGETTVKTHVARLLSKLDLRDRIQAVVLAYETGIVQPTRRAAP